MATCFECQTKIAENSKYCANCGIVQPPATTPTPPASPIVEKTVEKTVEQEFEEFLEDLRKKIYISAKLTKSPFRAIVMNILEKYDLKVLPEKFKQFGPLFIKDGLVGESVLLCKYSDIIPVKYHNVITPQAAFESYKADNNSVIGTYICISATLESVGSNKFKCGFLKNFFNVINSICITRIAISEEDIVKHLEAIKPTLGDLIG